MILTDDKEVVIDIEMSKLIYEYVVGEHRHVNIAGLMQSFLDHLGQQDRILSDQDYEYVVREQYIGLTRYE